MKTLPPDLDAETLLGALSTAGARSIAGPVHTFPHVGSTMDETRRLAEAGAPEGTVVVADEQADGRGRLGRSWVAPAGTSLLFTVLFRPPAAVPLAQVPMAVALGTLEALRIGVIDRAGHRAAVSLALKWPNDFWASAGDRGAKFGGLLTEVLPDGVGGRPPAPALLVGLGLNFGQAEAELPAGAVSLARLGLHVANRAVMLGSILATTERYYDALVGGTDLVPQWSLELMTLGREVTVETPDGPMTGVAVGVSPQGALLVRDDAGEVHPIQAGDAGLA